MNNNEEEIETIFKVEPPLSVINDGFGYMGVVLRNKVMDKIQCHICGKWFKNLSMHITCGHKIKTEVYKVTYGLPLGFPLCSKGFSEQASKRCLKLKSWKNLDGKRNLNKAKKNCAKWKMRRVKKYMAYQNSIGSCPEQINKRFLVVADTIGKTPNQNDLLEHDPKLWSIIRRRYNNSINEFRRINFYGNSELSLNSGKRYTNTKLIALLRKKAKEIRSVPTSNMFRIGSPNVMTYRKKFGSWNRALAMAGLI